MPPAEAQDEPEGTRGEEPSSLTSFLLPKPLVSQGRRDKKRPAEPSVAAGDHAEKELSMHEAMLEALVEELDAKGIISYSDWEARAKRKLAEQEGSGR
jgi:hypothetical protein